VANNNRKDSAENECRAIWMKVPLIIEMADRADAKIEQKGELRKRNDKSIDADSKQIILEDGSGMAHEEKRLELSLFIFMKKSDPSNKLFENEPFQCISIVPHEMPANIFTSLSRQFKSQIRKNIVKYITISYCLHIQNLKRKTIFRLACVPIPEHVPRSKFMVCL
jgi:hypothetical protein